MERPFSEQRDKESPPCQITQIGLMGTIAFLPEFGSTFERSAEIAQAVAASPFMRFHPAFKPEVKQRTKTLKEQGGFDEKAG